jgi:hypothetical protein
VPEFKTPNDVELLRIAPLSEAARLSGLDEDELRKLYPKWIIKLSEKKDGMRVMHALRLVPV